MVNLRIVTGYDIDQGLVPDGNLPQFFGVVRGGGEHYLVSEVEYDRAKQFGQFVGRISEEGQVVDKTYLPKSVYHVNSVDSEGNLKVFRVTDFKIILDVMKNGKRVCADENALEKMQEAA